MKRRRYTWINGFYVIDYIRATVKDERGRKKGRTISGSTSFSLLSLIVTQILNTIHTHRSMVVILSREGLDLYKNPRVNLSA